MESWPLTDEASSGSSVCRPLSRCGRNGHGLLKGPTTSLRPGSGIRSGGGIRAESGRSLLTDAVTAMGPSWRSCLCTSPSTGRSSSSASSGTAMPDHLAPICGQGEQGVAARALRSALREGGVDLFVGENVPATQGWAALLGGKVLRRTGSPVLRFRGENWESVLARASHNTRGQVRRRERKFKREHDVQFRLAGDRERLDDDLDTLFALSPSALARSRHVSAKAARLCIANSRMLL